MILDSLQTMSSKIPVDSSRQSFSKAIELRPFVKWAGGKQALAAQISSLFPNSHGRYYEPFIGGGSVYLKFAPRDAVISDHNQWLIDTYKAIREDWSAVTEVLDRLPNTKEDFLRIRGTDTSALDIFTRAAYFIYLNKTCFRGLFRVNRKGEFNVPYGNYNRRYYDPENLSQVAKHLANTEIRSGDYELCLYDIQKDDFVYFDPPYYKYGGYSDFNRYTENQFNEKDQLRLAAFCQELSSKGISWALSNSDTKFIRLLYRDFEVTEIDARREINLKSKNRKIKELLFTNYSQ